MLITFKSKADADVIMFGEVAQAMLTALGKDSQDHQGIVTLEQLPAAIARLKAAMAQDKTAPQPVDDEEDEERPRGMAAPVSFFQRAAPLLQLMERSLREGQPVIWGSQG